MHSLLLKIANVAVIAHMTFGCSLHHGFAAHTCGSESASLCIHDQDPQPDECCGHSESDHGHNAPAQHSDSPPVSSNGENAAGHGHGHLGCSDDSCNAIQVVKFEFAPLDFTNQYLGGAESLALVQEQVLNESELDPLSDCGYPAVAVRAHLLLGVLII